MTSPQKLMLALAALVLGVSGAGQAQAVNNTVLFGPMADCQGGICANMAPPCPCMVDVGVMQPNERAQYYNWNRPYAHVQYGQPVALVVPPTAQLQTNWGWGVSSMRVSRIDHQFGRNYPGAGVFGGPIKNTPRWPQDTNQFGVYYVRGPW